MTLLEYEQNRTIVILKRLLREFIRQWDSGNLCGTGPAECGRCERLRAEAKIALDKYPRPVR